MKLSELKDRKILILGMGKEGLVTVRFLRSKFPEMRIGVADLKELKYFENETAEFLKNGNFELHLGANYLDCLKDYEIVIKSPGTNPRQKPIMEACSAGVIFTSPTRIFFANVTGRVVGITGSKGKSTTSSLIYAVLKEGGLDVELVGNIGRGALEYLVNDSPSKVFVFEMSSYQLEDFDQSPDIAVLVSFFPDHLDYHKTMDEYFAAKMQLVSHLRPGTAVVYNAKSPEISEYVNKNLGGRADIQKVGFDDGESSRIEGAAAWLGAEKLVDLSEIQLLGRHNLQNMLAAAAVGRIFDLSPETIRKALRQFNGLEHRLEKVGVFNKIIFFNDAISTTPESTIAGLEALSGAGLKIGTIFSGGLDRGYKFDKLAEKIIQLGVKNVLIFPETGEQIWNAIENEANLKGAILPNPVRVAKMEDAVKLAFELTPENTVCLLSNASPSYNLFKNFEDKGRQFKFWINELAKIFVQ